MRITVVGRGNVGGGLARLWEKAGHDVTALGSEGGDGSDADVVVVAVPSGAIDDALGKVSGIEGLDRARLLEEHLALMFAINQGGMGQFFYRIAKPGEL